MYFIKSAQRQFVIRNQLNSYLILNSKVMDFNQKFDYTAKEFQTIFNILMGSEKIDLKENDYYTLLLPVLYYVSSFDKKAVQVYSQYYLNNSFLTKKLSDSEKMHTIFNIIEYEKVDFLPYIVVVVSLISDTEKLFSISSSCIHRDEP